MFEIEDLDADTRTVYATVVAGQPITLDQLSRASGVGGARLHEVTSRLESLGLVARAAGEESRLVAAPPDIALEALLLSKEEQLKQAWAWARRLAEDYRRSSIAADPARLVEIVVGRQAVFQRFQQMQRASRRQIRMIDKPPYATRDPDVNIGDERDLLNRGVTWRVIYDSAGLDAFHRLDGDILSTIVAGEQARVLSSTPTKLMITDDRLGMIPLQVAPHSIDSIVVVHQSALLEALSELFEQLWLRAIPLAAPGEAAAAASETEPTAADLLMLGMLTAGLPDERIAQRMGISLRTMQRRLSDLLYRLGATTRFQAGIRAATLGWIPQPAAGPETPETDHG